MKSETPRTDSIELKYHHMMWGDMVRAAECEQLERELNAGLADKQRLDALESIPHQMMISFDSGQPKAGSTPSLRSQIDYFLEQRAAAMPNIRS